ACYNASSTTYTSFPFQFTKDQTTVKISIVPRSEKTGLQSYYMEYVFPKKKIYYFGVSAGMFGSFLSNDYYSYQKNSSDSTFTLVKEDSDKLEFGFCTMFRFGTTMGVDWLHWHVGIG